MLANKGGSAAVAEPRLGRNHQLASRLRAERHQSCRVWVHQREGLGDAQQQIVLGAADGSVRPERLGLGPSGGIRACSPPDAANTWALTSSGRRGCQAAAGRDSGSADRADAATSRHSTTNAGASTNPDP